MRRELQELTAMKTGGKHRMPEKAGKFKNSLIINTYVADFPFHYSFSLFQFVIIIWWSGQFMVLK